LFGPDVAAGPTPGAKKYTVLIPVADPESGAPLLRLAAALGGPPESSRVLALHLRRPVDHEAYRAGLDEAAATADPALDPLLALARTHKIDVEPITFVSRDIPEDISSIARARQANLLLMGFHRPVFGSAILGGTVHRVLTSAPADIAIFVNRSDDAPRKILVPYLGSAHDRLALELAGRLAKSMSATITALHVVPPARGGDDRTLGAKSEVDKVFNEPGQTSPVTFRVVEDSSPVDAVLRESDNADLVVIGVAEEFGLESHLFGFRPQRIALECPKSLLIVRKFVRGSAVAKT
jgi:nucleotide-binding universal stress UspA family protein